MVCKFRRRPGPTPCPYTPLVRPDPDLLIRRRYTESQVECISWRGRIENVRGAFALRPGRAVAGRRIILIDDVMTSGATVNACAKALKRAEAVSVGVLTLARVAKLGD
mgnify:CR=1 FL=1